MHSIYFDKLEKTFAKTKKQILSNRDLSLHRHLKLINFSLPIQPASALTFRQ